MKSEIVIKLKFEKENTKSNYFLLGVLIIDISYYALSIHMKLWYFITKITYYGFLKMKIQMKTEY